jgi:hypothetical protein
MTVEVDELSSTWLPPTILTAPDSSSIPPMLNAWFPFTRLGEIVRSPLLTMIPPALACCDVEHPRAWRGLPNLDRVACFVLDHEARRKC